MQFGYETVFGFSSLGDVVDFLSSAHDCYVAWVGCLVLCFFEPRKALKGTELGLSAGVVACGAGPRIGTNRHECF